MTARICIEREIGRKDGCRIKEFFRMTRIHQDTVRRRLDRRRVRCILAQSNDGLQPARAALNVGGFFLRTRRIDAPDRGRDITAIDPAQTRGTCAKTAIPGDLSGEASMTTTTHRVQISGMRRARAIPALKRFRPARRF